ncbi:hypothetical protein KR009_001169 [Drosophila setifemur]|nr:hypothetical protein KR009_001169 [Drosophila setifemur]
MGSIEKACISGFLCRLCSEMHRTVIHIYSDHGQRLCLVEKINGYLPITISPTDPLPKTICKTCLHRVEQHYSLLMRLTRMRREHKIKFFENKSRPEPVRPQENNLLSLTLLIPFATPQINSSISSVDCSDEEEQGPRVAKSSRATASRSDSQDEGAGPSNRNSIEAGPSNRNSKEAGPSNRDPKETGNHTTNQELT